MYLFSMSMEIWKELLYFQLLNPSFFILPPWWIGKTCLEPIMQGLFTMTLLVYRDSLNCCLVIYAFLCLIFCVERNFYASYCRTLFSTSISKNIFSWCTEDSSFKLKFRRYYSNMWPVKVENPKASLFSYALTKIEFGIATLAMN